MRYRDRAFVRICVSTHRNHLPARAVATIGWRTTKSTQTDPAPPSAAFAPWSSGQAKVIHGDCMEWLKQQERNSIHAVVTDPPYGLVEYSSKEQEKLRNGTGGVWRIPPSFDGASRSPLPRFTVLSPDDLRALSEYFSRWAKLLTPVLVPGANVIVATNPLLSHVVAGALAAMGLERRGEIVSARDDHARRATVQRAHTTSSRTSA